VRSTCAEAGQRVREPEDYRTDRRPFFLGAGWECVGNNRRSSVRESGTENFCNLDSPAHPRILQKRRLALSLFLTTYNHERFHVRFGRSRLVRLDVHPDVTENLFKTSQKQQSSPTGTKSSIGSSSMPSARPWTSLTDPFSTASTTWI